MKSSKLLTIERFARPFAHYLSNERAVQMYSNGRKYFLSNYYAEHCEPYNPPLTLTRKLWGIPFRSGLMNAAGMFKNAESYELVKNQGAGGYLAGTVTVGARLGNKKEGIHLPFVPYRNSHAASNWLGLPNSGTDELTKRIQYIKTGESESNNRFPIGVSITRNPDQSEELGMINLVAALKQFEALGVDFIEMNESCPNTEAQESKQSMREKNEKLEKRLQYIHEQYVKQRKRNMPIIAKFSTDTCELQLPFLLDMLLSYEFDGINLGNTSTQYEKIRHMIDEKDRALFDYFTKTFGGGVSGKPLKEKSLELAARAVAYNKIGGHGKEFHVIRTGGIDSAKDIVDSDNAGISMNMWFTGYFENLAKHGHDLYKALYEESKTKEKKDMPVMMY
jgi:dihydroorotate dehydrogenase